MRFIFKSIANKAPLFSIAASLFLPQLSTDSYAQVDDILNDIALESAEEKIDPDPATGTEPREPEHTQPRITLINGDKLTGQPLDIDKSSNLSFTSQSLHGKAEFPLSKILTLDLDTWAPSLPEKAFARIQIQPSFRALRGDTLTGELQELTPDNIAIKTQHGGVIQIKRSMTKSLDIINYGPGSYYGPNNIQEWTRPRGKHTWKFSNGSVFSNDEGSIGRDVGLTEKSHIRFKAKWGKTMRFHVRLYSSDVKEANPDAYYDVYFNQTYVYLQTRGKGNPGANRVLQQINNTSSDLQAQFDIFMDRKSGVFTVYMNDTQLCTLRSGSPDPENLGTGLSFVSEKNNPIEISHIRLRPWNGITLPSPPSFIKKDNTEKEDSDQEEPPHYIVLQNGDEVSGTAEKVEDGRVIVETEHTPIRIPIERIRSLRQGNAEEQPKKYAKDIRAWFHEGGHITLRLKTFEEGKVIGYNQACGEVSFDLEAFRKIDFHIYDQDYNQLRNEHN